MTMNDENIFKFPAPVDKVWEEINRALIKALENQGLPVDVSIAVRKWTKEIYDQHRKMIRIPITINIPSVPLELQKKIDESIKESADLFIKECGKQMFDLLVVMIMTKIECEKAKHDLRLRSFMHD